MGSRTASPVDATGRRMTPVERIVPGVPVRKRGRPPKVESAPVFNSLTDSSTPSTKKRGRKSLTELAREAESKGNLSDSSFPASPSSEKRGRLSTWAYAEYSDASDNEIHEKSARRQKKTGGTPASRKKRGRPPKSPVKNMQSDTAIDGSGGSKRKRGRPPKKRVDDSGTNIENKEDEIHNGTLKRSYSPDNVESESFNVQKVNSYSDTGAVVTEKRRRGRPKKTEKSNLVGKWTDGIAPSTGRYTLPLPVPDSWPIVFNMEEIMKELSEMYANVKEQKRGEFHNQIKAFVFALHWEDGSFSTS